MSRITVVLLLALGGCAEIARPEPPGQTPSGRDYDLGFGGHVQEDSDMASHSPASGDLGAHDLATTPSGLACHVVINEVQTGTTQTGTAEFVEVYNPCTSAAALGGWKLVYRAASNTSAKSASDTGTLYTFTSGTLPAGGYRVYAGSGFTGAHDGVLASGMAATGAVGIRDSAGALIDSVAWGSPTATGFAETNAASAPPVIAAPGNSISRLPNGVDSDDNSIDFVKSSPPTPGAANQ